ncbi:hypothetical protein NDU88_008701 [Pleurodeles waltl]|uniref:Uncharacterized protein n=1 Tax=Pleurodeles waltl TaxID=8319 RepID=A0AAV7NYQ2_PLEWA|nr:hypothetical protein NDU88_008701 [Pleurodeles waltl]
MEGYCGAGRCAQAPARGATWASRACGMSGEGDGAPVVNTQWAQGKPCPGHCGLFLLVFTGICLPGKYCGCVGVQMGGYASGHQGDGRHELL